MLVDKKKSTESTNTIIYIVSFSNRIKDEEIESWINKYRSVEIENQELKNDFSKLSHTLVTFQQLADEQETIAKEMEMKLSVVEAENRELKAKLAEFESKLNSSSIC